MSNPGDKGPNNGGKVSDEQFMRSIRAIDDDWMTMPIEFVCDELRESGVDMDQLEQRAKELAALAKRGSG